MSFEILKYDENSIFNGCDFVVRLPENRANTEIKILQITDMQVIDASQRRTPERLRADEVEAWAPENFDLQYGNHVRSLITQTKPDLIIITGDIVYGSFDDEGTTLLRSIELMDSFKIPWAPVFGNHDNESKRGVDWQCEMLEKSEYCLFRRGEVTGNGNYSVGVAVGDRLVRVLHMLDSNGCWGSSDPAIKHEAGIYQDQLDLVKKNTDLIRTAQGRKVPAFAAYHIPSNDFILAEEKKGYKTGENDEYVLGVDFPAKDDDFGFCLQKRHYIKDGNYLDVFLENDIDGVFAGHVHDNCLSISYGGIVWTLGLKTGQYDHHVPYQIGGTLIRLIGERFTVTHIPSLVRCAIMPGRAPMFSGLLSLAE